MSKVISRRSLITAGVAASATGAALFVAKRNGLIPPDHGGLFGVEETLTYASHRVLLHNQPLAREFRRDQISTNFPAINTVMPADDDYRREMAGGFRTWRLAADGMIKRPYEFSLA